MKKLTFLFIIAFSPGLFAQSIERYVISSCGGDFFDGTSTAIDFTTGEVAVTTISNSTVTLTQGFHQPYLNYYVSVPENYGNPFHADIYPNPVIDQFQISISNAKNADIRVYVYDILGQLLMNENLRTDMDGMAMTNFNLKSLSTGNYFIRVMQGKKIITCQKIIKINQ
jgi:hypothetical protein